MDDNQRGGRAFDASGIEPIEPSMWPRRRSGSPEPDGLGDDDWDRLRRDRAATDGGAEPIDWSVREHVDPVVSVTPDDVLDAHGQVVAHPADDEVPRASRGRLALRTSGAVALAAALAALGLSTRPSDRNGDAPPATIAVLPATVVAPVTTVTSAPPPTPAPAPPTPAPAPTTRATPPTTVAVRPPELSAVVAAEDLGGHPWWGEIEGGRVRLLGRVRTKAAAEAAVAAARAGIGAAPLADELVVDPSAPPPPGPVPLFLLEPIEFDSGSAEVGSATEDRLVGFARVALFLQPSVQLRVVGSRAPGEEAVLAGRRAGAVADAVAGDGVDRGRIVAAARPSGGDRTATLVFYGLLG